VAGFFFASNELQCNLAIDRRTNFGRFDRRVWGFNRSTSLTAMVPGIGVLQPAALDDLTWAEYGARIGYHISDATTLDLFANGVTGGGGIDTRIHTGAALRFQF
jgi:hypothetical protein